MHRKTILDAKFDLILLDLAMPVFSAIDVIASLKKTVYLMPKTLFFLLHLQTQKIIEEMKYSSIKEILKKPISIDELTSFIDRYNPDT